MAIEKKQFSTKVQSASDEGIITALVSVFGNTDHANEKVMPGAFKASLARKLPKGVWAHDWSKPCAKTLEAYETAQGLVVKAQFNLNTMVGKEAFSNIKFFGAEQEFSIGYSVVRDSIEEKTGVRELHELRCHEWSPVLVGMNPATELLAIKSNEVSMQVDEVTKSNRPNFGGNPDPKGAYGGQSGNVLGFPHKGIGQQFVESKEYQNFRAQRFPTGAESDSVTLDIGIKVLTTSTGWAPEAVRSSVVVPYATYQPHLTDIIPTIQTNQNAFVYMEENVFDNQAHEVLEGAAKPESNLGLVERSAAIRKIPTWIAATDEQLEDVVSMQSYLENRLSLMVRQRLEGQLLVGDGITPNIQGLTSLPGILSQAKGVLPTIDAIYLALTKVQVTGQAIPNYIVMHPNDFSEIRLLRTTDGLYIMGNPTEVGPHRLWGLPVVLSQRLSEGVAIVGDFANYSLLIERKGLQIKVGYQNDDFIKNQRTIIAEVRCCAAWLRPQAFCLVTGI